MQKIFNWIIGDVTSIRIGHDNSGAGPAWYLTQVVVLCEETNKQFMFYCERWYACVIFVLCRRCFDFIE